MGAIIRGRDPQVRAAGANNQRPAFSQQEAWLQLLTVACMHRQGFLKGSTMCCAGVTCLGNCSQHCCIWCTGNATPLQVEEGTNMLHGHLALHR